MSQITKDELKARGFKRWGFHVMMKHTDSGTSITVNHHDPYIELENCNDSIVVTNCKTLEDLDHLIRLFQ